MLPVNFFHRPLISDAICERQRSARSDRRRGHTSLRSAGTAGVRQREWDCGDGDKCKQDKCASKNLRFDRRVSLFFHRVVPVKSGLLACSIPAPALQGEAGEKWKSLRKAEGGLALEAVRIACARVLPIVEKPPFFVSWNPRWLIVDF